MVSCAKYISLSRQEKGRGRRRSEREQESTQWTPPHGALPEVSIQRDGYAREGQRTLGYTTYYSSNLQDRVDSSSMGHVKTHQGLPRGLFL